MNVFLKINIILFVFFAPGFYLHAQDLSPEDRVSGAGDTDPDDGSRDYGDSYFPDYRIEVFHEAAESEGAILPFVYNGYLYTFSLEQRLPLWRIFIGGDLANPFTTNDQNLYIYDVFNRVYSVSIWTQIKSRKSYAQEYLYAFSYKRC